MKEYIDKGKFGMLIADYQLGYSSAKDIEKYEALETVLAMLDNTPAADVVEVVRCKDCVHWGKPQPNKAAICYALSRFGSFYTNEIQWCCFGERKELAVLDAAESADVVEVVRCKDCKYNNCCLLQSFVEDNSKDEIPFDPNTWYCPDGERKEKE